MRENDVVAVLTGDIVKSSRLSRPELDAVRELLRERLAEVGGWKPGLVKGTPEFFRGDGWQVLLTDPALTLRVVVFLRASLRTLGKADSRIAIGLGRAGALRHQKLSLSTGEAFLLSGHGLDRLSPSERMTIEIAASQSGIAGWLKIVARLCDALVSRWTGRQAEIVCRAACPGEPTHEEIAERLSPTVSRQTVSKALQGADWHAVRDAIRGFEGTCWESLLAPPGP